MQRRFVWLLLIALLLIPLSGVAAAPITQSNPEKMIQQTSEEEYQVIREMIEHELDLMRVNLELQQLESRIRDLELARDQARAALDASERMMRDRSDLIRKRLRFLYEDGRVSYLEVLLQATDFRDLLSRFDLVQAIITNDIKVLKETHALRQEITKKTQALAEQQRLLGGEQQALSDKKEEVTAVIARRESYLQSLRDKRHYYQAMVDDVVDRWNEQIMPEITHLAYNIGYVVSDPAIVKEADLEVSLFPPGLVVGITDSALNKRLWAREKSLTPFQVVFEEGQVVIRRDLDYELRVTGHFDLDDKQQIVFTVTDMTLDGLSISESLRQTLFRGMQVSFNPSALPMNMKVSGFITKPGKLKMRLAI